MTRTPRFFVPTMVAVLVTVLMGGLLSLVQAAEDGLSPLLAAASFLVMLAPYVLPVIWAWALLTVRPLRLVLMGLALWLVIGLMLLSWDTTWLLTTHVVCGLVVAGGLLARVKPGVILALLAVITLPLFLWTLKQVPLDQTFADIKTQVLDDRRELLAAGNQAGGHLPALEKEEQVLDDLFRVVKQLLPGSVALWLLSQAGVTFALIWVLVRFLGLSGVLRGFPVFGRWRFPFAVVWMLALAVGLMILPLPWWPYAGANLALLVVHLLAIQGAAVQWRLSAISFPLGPRLFFMFVAGMLFLPLVLLGLADQWLDFRKLDSEEPPGSDSPGGDDDDPAPVTDRTSLR